MMTGGRRLRDGRVLYWWVEILAILGFYAVYSAIRNANGSHPLRAFHNAKHIISLEHHLGDLPRSRRSRVGAALQAAHHHRELHVRIAALHRDDLGRVWLFRSLQRRLPALPQHARDHHRARADRLHAVPAHAAAALAPTVVCTTCNSSGSSTRSHKYPTFWSFDSGPAARSRTSTRRCRACTSAGPRGARSRWCRA